MNYHPIQLLRQQQGLSLVELMIAMTLGLFLIWGVTQSFLTSRQVYDMQQGLSQIQENTRLAQEFLAFDIRNAGDYGCASGDAFLTGPADLLTDATCGTGTLPDIVGTTDINMLTAPNSVDDEFQYAVYGFNNYVAGGNLTIGTATVALDPEPKAGTDVLMVHTATDIGVVALNGILSTDTVPASPDLAVDITGINLAAGSLEDVRATDRIAVSDCATTKIFAIAAAITEGDGTFNLASSPTNYCTAAAFQTGASVRRVNTIYYYIADTGRDDTNGQPVYSLFRALGSNTVTGALADELLEGVEDMQLSFGIDNINNADGIIDVYKAANDTSGTAPTTAADWEKAWNGWDWDTTAVPQHHNYELVRAVRFSLLISTSNKNLMAEEQQLAFNGTTLYGGNPTAGSGDRALRQVVTSTVGIRSRVK